MPDGLYERDILLWSERQAELLRRLAAGERLNEAVDWPNVIEELEAVGRSELRACGSLLRQALVHLIKLHLKPGSEAAGHWTSEVLGFLDEAREAFAPSMSQHIDLEKLHSSAAKRALAQTGFEGRLSAGCPFTLDELLAEDPDVASLAARLA